MNLNFIGFPNTDVDKAAQNKVSNRIASVGPIIKAGARVLSDTSNIQNKKLFTKWFGSKGENEDYEPVARNMQIISEGHRSGTVLVVHHIEFITQKHLAANYCEGKLAEGSFGPAKYSEIAENFQVLMLCPEFWNLPINYRGRGETPQQTQMGTLMHEMTHMFANTDDKGYDGTDNTAYGSVNCIRTAKRSVSRARMNAENYCFYLFELQFTSATSSYI